MKAEDVIKMVRRDVEEMWNKHLTWIKTNGAEGMPCLDIPAMEKLRARTDREILDKAVSRGVYVIDREEYLAKLETEEK